MNPSEREHIESVGADASEECMERWAIMTEDGRISEREAWRLAYVRTCLHYGVKPLSGQVALPGVAA